MKEPTHAQRREHAKLASLFPRWLGAGVSEATKGPSARNSALAEGPSELERSRRTNPRKAHSTGTSASTRESMGTAVACLPIHRQSVGCPETGSPSGLTWMMLGRAAWAKRGSDPSKGAFRNVGTLRCCPNSRQGLGRAQPAGDSSRRGQRVRSTLRTGKPSAWGRRPVVWENGRESWRCP